MSGDVVRIQPQQFVHILDQVCIDYSKTITTDNQLNWVKLVRVDMYPG